MSKITREEYEQCLQNTSDIAIYRMYTKTGYTLIMKLAKILYKNYNKFTLAIVQIPVFFIDIIDIFCFVFSKIGGRHVKK